MSNSRRDSHTVDGTGYKDFIQITFSAMVKIKNISFGYYDGYDDFRVLTDASGDGKIGVGDAYSEEFKVTENNPFTGFGSELTNIFAVGAFGGKTCTGRYWWNKRCTPGDSWKLETVTVHYDPAVVPLPAAGWLLIGALGGLGAIRRKKS